MSAETEKQMLQQLSAIRNLLALLVTSAHDTLATRAKALVAAGLSAKEVAPLLDSTPNAVSVAIYTSKKTAKKKTSRKAKKGH